MKKTPLGGKLILSFSLNGFLFLLGIGLAGCSSAYQPSTFLSPTPSLAPGKYFEQEYTAPGIRFRDYRKVKINPVNLEYLENKKEYEERESVKKSMLQVAQFFQDHLEEQLGQHYQVVDAAAPADHETLVVIPALIRIGPSYRLMDVQSRGVGTTMEGSMMLAMSIFEAKILDGGTGNTLAFIAEKRSSVRKKSVIRASPFTHFPYAEIDCEKWAARLRRMLESG